MLTTIESNSIGSQIDDMIERNSVNITLHDVDPTALRQLIDYTYTGEITITEDNVQVKEKKNQNVFLTQTQTCTRHIFDTSFNLDSMKCVRA